MLIAASASAITVEKREKISSIYSKKHGKRGAFSVEYGYPSQEPAPIYEAPNQQIPVGYDYSHPSPILPQHPEPIQPPVAVQPVG